MGWEVWFTYGLWGGDPVDERRPEPLNRIIPKHINWILNSLADGSICMVAILLIYLGNIETGAEYHILFGSVLVRKEGLKKFRWSGLSIAFIWFIFQNIVVEMIVYNNQLAGKEVSWAPLTPFGPWVNPTLFSIGTATCTLQGQLPWLIMTPVFYFVLLKEKARYKQNEKFH